MSNDDMLAEVSAKWSSEFGREVDFQSCGCDTDCGSVSVSIGEQSVGRWQSMSAAEEGVARLWMIL